MNVDQRFRSDRHRKSTLINGRMTARRCHRTVYIRVSMRKKHGFYVSLNYKLKGPKRIFDILVDRDIAVRLDTNKLSIILSLQLYMTFVLGISDFKM